MFNLYSVLKAVAESAAHFGIDNPIASNAGEKINLRSPSMVIRQQDSQREIQFMTWGVPLHCKAMALDLQAEVGLIHASGLPSISARFCEQVFEELVGWLLDAG